MANFLLFSQALANPNFHKGSIDNLKISPKPHLYIWAVYFESGVSPFSKKIEFAIDFFYCARGGSPLNRKILHIILYIKKNK